VYTRHRPQQNKSKISVKHFVFWPNFYWIRFLSQWALFTRQVCTCNSETSCVKSLIFPWVTQHASNEDNIPTLSWAIKSNHIRRYPSCQNNNNILVYFSDFLFHSTLLVFKCPVWTHTHHTATCESFIPRWTHVMQRSRKKEGCNSQAETVGRDFPLCVYVGIGNVFVCECGALCFCRCPESDRSQSYRQRSSQPASQPAHPFAFRQTQCLCNREETRRLP
jgi:hypothetical protein